MHDSLSLALSFSFPRIVSTLSFFYTAQNAVYTANEKKVENFRITKLLVHFPT